MSVDLSTWRSRIGLHNILKTKTFRNKDQNKNFLLFLLLLIKFFLFKIDLSNTKNKLVCLALPYCFIVINYWWVLLVLIRCGDVEENPGPLKLFHWNPNSICTENFSRLTLIESLNQSTNYDIIAITESGLHPYVENEYLKIPGYQIYRRDLPDNISHGGVLVYYKDSLIIKERPEFELNANQMVLEITIKKKKLFLSVNYRRHHKNIEELATFMENFENSITLMKTESPYCSIHIGDFNCRQKSWWDGDNDDAPGNLLNEIITSENFSQLVSEPTHIIGPHRSCIDLVLTDQPNIVNDCSVLPSLHTRCHHQINHIELCIENPPPPPYVRRIWHYQRAQRNAIKSAINSFNWEHKLLEYSNDPNKQAEFFSETLLNIFSNFIPNEHKKVKPRDPPWFTKNIKSTYQKYQRSYKKFRNKGFPQNKSSEIDRLKKEYTDMVLEAKEKYLISQGSKLSQADTPIKNYWTILKKFITSSSIATIPALIVNNCYITDISEKCKHFNDYFAKQCTVLDTGSHLPDFFLRTQVKLNNVYFSKSDLEDLIKNLDCGKAHGFDEISVRMIKLCEKSIIDPLYIILQNCAEKGVFPECWKKANVIPIHKKNQKNLIKNYRPISLLPIFGKLFEKMIFKSLYNHLIQNDLISSKQSGFIKGDSTINQLLSITDMINSSFDCDVPKEVRSVFLDISKAFDKVWHAGLLFKLKQNGIEGKMYRLLENFLSDRKQRVTINGKMSSWTNVEAWVPQGSVLGPILFLVYINDLILGLKSDARVFADDTSLFVRVDDIDAAHQTLVHDLNFIEKWARQWRFEFNPDPIKPPIELIFSTKNKPPNHPQLYFNNIALIKVNEHKHLGLILDKKLTFSSHIKEKINKAKRCLGALKFSSQYLPVSAIDRVYKSFIRPKMEYGDIIYHRTPCVKDHLFPLDVTKISSDMAKLESVQYQAALTVSGAWKGSSKTKIYKELGWEFLSHRRWSRQLALFFKIVNGFSPMYLKEKVVSSPSLRNYTKQLLKIHVRTKRYMATFFPSCIFSWNNVLSSNDRMAKSLSEFKAKLNTLIKPEKTNNFGINSKSSLRHIYQLRVGLSVLAMHKKLHNFSDTEDSMCPFMDGEEDITHFFLKCKKFYAERKVLFNSIFATTGINLLTTPKKRTINLLLYGEPTLDPGINKKILLASIQYILSTKRFSSQ